MNNLNRNVLKMYFKELVMKKRIFVMILFSVITCQIFANPKNQNNIVFNLNENTNLNVSKVHYRRHPPRPRRPSRHHYESTFSDFIGDVFGMLWLFNNIGVTFDDYPYSDGRYLNFFTQKMFAFSDEFYFDDSDGSGNFKNPPKKNKEQSYRFALETGIFYFTSEKIMGNESRFEGYIWKFFGPVFENTLYANKNSFSDFSENFCGNLRLGGQFSLIHSNFFDTSFFMQWTYWYGQSLKLSGFNFGFIVRSYPIKPALFEWRCNFQCFDYTDSIIFDSHLELGIELNSPFEVYVAWKYRQDEVIAKNISNAAAAGIKYNF